MWNACLFCICLHGPYFVPHPETRYHHHIGSAGVGSSIVEVMLDSDGEIRLTGNLVGGFYSGPDPSLIRPHKPNETVYELRSGMVIKGNINSRLKFVPERGSTVITFQDYLKDYQPFRTPRIYNLPGTIVWWKAVCRVNQ